MSDPDTDSAAKNPKNQKPKRRGRLLLIIGAVFVLIGAGGAGAYFFLPGVAESLRASLGGLLPGGPATPPAAAPVAKSAFVELPEMTLTLPNGGRPRQLRLTLAIEVSGDPELVKPALISPRVFDSLILYLRTLRDGELEGALAIDRLRGDLFRRLDLLLGPNVVRDVLITGFVVA